MLSEDKNTSTKPYASSSTGHGGQICR
jgi:hypothetical protein